MKKLFSTFCFCFFMFVLGAQSNINCSADLEKLYAVLQKTPSYKQQIKGSKKTEFQQLYTALKKDAIAATGNFECFKLLSRLLLPLKDNHLYFYQTPSQYFTPAKLADSSLIQKYKSSAVFKNHPKVYVNLDSLQTALQTKHRDSVEGIYYYGNEIKAGVYRDIKANTVLGVVLSTTLPIWENGQLLFVLNEYLPNRFRSFQANVYSKTFGFQKNEKFQHSTLTEANWKKFPDEKDYVNIESTAPFFNLKRLGNNIQYLRLGSFATTPKNMAAAQTFYTTVKDSINSGNLIVDLRNNGGGGFKTSRKFLKLLKQRDRKAALYVLINNRTFSNAEQFAIKLMGLKNVVLLGEATNGTLTYGNNRGAVETLPSGHYKLYITDMRGTRKDLAYEEKGLSPQIYLKPSADWVEQTIQFIKETESR